jgi:hypothetical protein
MIEEIPGEPIGVTFQRAVRSPEWKATLVVFEKYKRTMNLDYPDLISLKDYIVSYSLSRAASGKKVGKDLLIQECSAELKRRDKTKNEINNI